MKLGDLVHFPLDTEIYIIVKFYEYPYTSKKQALVIGQNGKRFAVWLADLRAIQ